jgi:hypothetical protein
MPIFIFWRLMTAKASSDGLMEEIVGLCKRRGFIFPSSEIYGGYNGFYDYGPLGVELRNNIKQAWWRDMVQRRDDIEGLDSTIIMHPYIWKASGHVDGLRKKPQRTLNAKLPNKAHSSRSCSRTTPNRSLRNTTSSLRQQLASQAR